MNSNGDSIANKSELLLSLLKDYKNANAIYKAGPYWEDFIKSAIKDIKRFGITDFKSGKGVFEFTEIPILDVRTQWNLGLKKYISFFQTKIYPFNKLFDFQVAYCEDLFHQLNERINQIILNDSELTLLLKNFKPPEDNIKGGKVNRDHGRPRPYPPALQLR
jgi:hypothetical protein